MNIDSNVETIRGVGALTAEKLARLGVVSVRDLLTYWPSRYEDYSVVTKIADLRPGPVSIKARVESVTARHSRRGLHITEAILRDDTEAIKAVWFNQPYRAKSFKEMQEYYFSGTYDFSFNNYVLQNPSVEQVGNFNKNTARIVPIYRQTKGLNSLEIRKIISEITPLFDNLPETLSPSLLKENDLIPYAKAARQMHWPDSTKDLEVARRRLSFDEILELQLASLLNKRDNSTESAPTLKFNETKAKEFVAKLPFDLTNAQKKAAWEILQDIAKVTPMNRLLEGDVGSGKTVVAAMAVMMAHHNGYQSVLLAPTEVLARQHADNLAKLLSPFGLNIVFLSGSVKSKSKEQIYQQLTSGEVDLAIGTHALLQDKVKFRSLGLVVVDEQHRFGVDQRRSLLSQGDYAPHILSMTATPIPRSLALALYGEMEVSIIDELPAGRQAIETEIVSPNSRAQLYFKVDAEIDNGRQVFIICPLIDESDTLGVKSVTAEYQRLQKGAFKHRRIAMLHGKMKSDDKNQIMQDFVDKKYDILLATTVIEVGIDVPNANVMIIEGAERFGLSQLHQLRGRVGRGKHQSYCYLVPSQSDGIKSKRLRSLVQVSDGFRLSEIDLKLRGPGALYGIRQHGALDLRLADITDIKLIKSSRRVAEQIIKDDPGMLKYPVLKEKVEAIRWRTYLN